MAALRRGRVVAQQEAVQGAKAAGRARMSGAGRDAGTSTRRAAASAAAVAGGASAAAEGGAAAQAAADRSTIEMVERAVFLHHPYESRERLRRVLPREIGVQALDRALEYLERSGKIAIEGEAIHWAAGPAGPDASKSGKRSGAPVADTKSVLAGTCFEWLEEGKLPTETIGEHIVRVFNAHEPGSYTAEDAKEFDEDMRRAAKGEYYTHEEFWKEFGP